MLKEFYSSKIDGELKSTIKELSKVTRIPQAKLLEEALEDLFKKYKKVLKK